MPLINAGAGRSSDWCSLIEPALGTLQRRQGSFTSSPRKGVAALTQPSSVLIIGASRGLGLGLAREYLARGWHVVATVRGDRHTGLHDLASDAERLQIETLDINEADETQALHRRLAGRRFDVLFVNAGIANDPGEQVGTTSTETFIRVMVTNALSPLRVIETLQDLVEPGGTIAAMSSGLGSVANNVSGGWEIYRASKAALNTLMRSFAARQSDKALRILVIAPGWVRTDMGGPNASLDVETSMRGVVDTVSRAHPGGVRYLDWQGQTVAW